MLRGSRRRRCDDGRNRYVGPSTWRRPRRGRPWWRWSRRRPRWRPLWRRPRWWSLWRPWWRSFCRQGSRRTLLARPLVWLRRRFLLAMDAGRIHLDLRLRWDDMASAGREISRRWPFPRLGDTLIVIALPRAPKLHRHFRLANGSRGAASAAPLFLEAAIFSRKPKSIPSQG